MGTESNEMYPSVQLNYYQKSITLELKSFCLFFLQCFHYYTDASSVECWKSWSNLLSFISVITIQIMGTRLSMSTKSMSTTRMRWWAPHHTNEMMSSTPHEWDDELRTTRMRWWAPHHTNEMMVNDDHSRPIKRKQSVL